MAQYQNAEEVKKIDFVKMFIVEELLYYISKLVIVRNNLERKGERGDDRLLQVLQLKRGRGYGGGAFAGVCAQGRLPLVGLLLKDRLLHLLDLGHRY